MRTKIVLTSLVKVLSALSGLALTSAVSRYLGAGEAGLFLLGLTLVTVLSVIFRLGMENHLVKTFGAEGLSGGAQALLNYALTRTFFISLIASTVVFLLSEQIAELVFGKPEFTVIIEHLGFAIPPLVAFGLFSSAFQGAQRVVLAVAFKTLLVSVFFLIMFYVAIAAQFITEDAASASLLYLFASFLTLGMAVLLWYAPIGSASSKSITYRGDVWQPSMNMWVVNCMSLAVNYSGMIIAGAYLTSEEFSQLFAAQRVAILVSFFLEVTNTVTASRYSDFWRRNNISKIRRLARLSVLFITSLALPIVMALAVFSRQVMGIFGDEFIGGASLLVILALGQLINVATGPSGYLLSMTGHEKDLRQVRVYAGIATVILAYVLTIQYGAVGAAIATALGLSFQNIGALIAVRKRLGFWVGVQE